jgi:hypothetical protein
VLLALIILFEEWGWKPLAVEHIRAGMDYTIYVYEVGRTK